MHPSYDITIVGAGVIGLTQAVALTAAGFKVALVDAQAKPVLSLPETFDVRVFALNRFSQRCLKKWGIWSHIESLRFAAYHQVALSFQQNHPELIFRDSDDAEPNLGYIVEQSVWREAALEQLAHHPYCDFFWQYAVQSIEQTDTGAVVSCAKTANNETLSIETKLVIGADGAHSTVRALSAMHVESYACQQTAVIFNIQVAQTHHFFAAQYFLPQGIIAFLPLADSHCFSIVWSMPDEVWQQNDLDDAALAALLNDLIAHKWGALSIISKRFSFPLAQAQAKQYVMKKTILIGDAAHTIHPLAGQGANLGIADIDALMTQLMIAKASARPIFDPQLLRKYARARRSAAGQMMGFMAVFSLCAGQTSLFNYALSQGSRLINRLIFLKNLLTRFALYQFTK